MEKPFVVVSGLPGSGKSRLARQLAPALGLPLIDKDDVLERLFESKGIGDTVWRRRLSRESDDILQTEAMASMGAVLASFWHLSGMPLDSGTPTRWLSEVSNLVVNVHCACPPEIAALRFLQRKRHPGHLDNEATYAELLVSLQALERHGHLDIVHRVDVDTSTDQNPDAVVRDIRAAFTRCL
jgi:hypothetical protein